VRAAGSVIGGSGTGLLPLSMRLRRRRLNWKQGRRCLRYVNVAPLVLGYSRGSEDDQTRFAQSGSFEDRRNTPFHPLASLLRPWTDLAGPASEGHLR
jgi:hypothetical protein